MTSQVAVRIRVDNRDPLPGGMEMGTDVIDVTTIGGRTLPNLAWEFTDPAGHFHAWDRAGTTPTLDKNLVHHLCEAESHEVGDGDDEDPCACWSEVKYACSICGWEVEPATMTDHSPEVVPGLSWWSVEVRGLELERGAKVSVVITAGDETPKFFGVAVAIATDYHTEEDKLLTVTRLQGTGALGRKR